MCLLDKRIKHPWKDRDCVMLVASEEENWGMRGGGNRCRSRRHRIWAYTIWMLSFKKKNVRASYHFIIYTSIESLCFIPEANVICQTHLNFKKWVSYFRKNLQKHTTTCTHAWDPRWALDTAWSPRTIGFPGKPPGKRENFHSTSFSIIQTELCEFFKKIPEGPKGRHKQKYIQCFG